MQTEVCLYLTGSTWQDIRFLFVFIEFVKKVTDNLEEEKKKKKNQMNI